MIVLGFNGGSNLVHEDSFERQPVFHVILQRC